MPANPTEGRAFINGSWQSFVSERAVQLVDPETGVASSSLALADDQIVDRAVAAAREAFVGRWRNTSRNTRLRALHALIDGIERRKPDFAALISREIGAPIDFAGAGHVDAGLKNLRDIADALASLENDTPVGGDPAHRVRYEPIGVAALITPWNWPLNQVVLKAGAALAAGCTMVLKPSELSTGASLLFTEVMADLGLPDGVFNMIPGDADTGRALVHNPQVDIVSFTGSTTAGADIAARCGQNLTRTLMELGGKSANILMADCDLSKAIRQGIAHCFRNAGQSCNAASRMLVDRKVYAQALDLAAAQAQAFPVDLPSKHGSHIGPQITQTQFNRVQEFIKGGIDRGLTVLAGGAGRPDHLAQGFFSKPTVFADVPVDDPLFSTEIFGPVLTITPFDTEEEAIALANATPYGLAAYVQTDRGDMADRMSRALRAGMVQVNGTSRAPGAPFGGVGASGWGREAGLYGIRAFQDVKSISGAARYDR